MVAITEVAIVILKLPILVSAMLDSWEPTALVALLLGACDEVFLSLSFVVLTPFFA